MTKEQTNKDMVWSKKLDIIISNIKVGKKYYSFDYVFKENGVITDKGNHDASHSRSPQYMRKHLKAGYAIELIMQKIYG